jgi:hypothetical protein
VAGLFALIALGCGSSGASTLNTATVERDIAATILAQHGLHVAVVCPHDVSREAGTSFACAVRLDAGRYPIAVTETNAAGRVRYVSTAPLAILDAASVERAIERSIAQQRRLGSRVSCPKQVLQGAGIRFTCLATVNGRRYPFEVVQTDGHGHVRYVGR